MSKSLWNISDIDKFCDWLEVHPMFEGSENPEQDVLTKSLLADVFLEWIEYNAPHSTP